MSSYAAKSACLAVCANQGAQPRWFSVKCRAPGSLLDGLMDQCTSCRGLRKGAVNVRVVMNHEATMLRVYGHAHRSRCERGTTKARSLACWRRPATAVSARQAETKSDWGSEGCWLQGFHLNALVNPQPLFLVIHLPEDLQGPSLS